MNFADENGYIEIIVYIVLMVLGLAASAYRNYTKRKEQRQKLPEDAMPDFPETTFEPIFDSEETHKGEALEEEIFEEDTFEEEIYREAPGSVEYTEPASAKEQPELIVSENTMSENKVVPEGQAVFDSTKKELLSDSYLTSLRKDTSGEISDDESVSENIQDDDETTGFDLKQAVIYSEIMNPKYL